jgi:NAD(P)-dependent dehydrogenase (short-subunit alcohol dehydrogenase family)
MGMRSTQGTRCGAPAELEKLAPFVASNDTSYITGQVGYIDCGRLPLKFRVPVAA